MASNIIVDNTEASIPSPSHTIVSNDRDWLLWLYDDEEKLDTITVDEMNRDWKKKLNIWYAIFQGSRLSCQDNKLPENLINVVFDYRLYFKSHKMKAQDYAKVHSCKIICSVKKTNYKENTDVW